MEFRSKVGEIFAGETELQRVVRAVGDKSGDFEQPDRGGMPLLCKLLHEGGPLSANSDVKVYDVDDIGSAELLEEGLRDSKVGEMEDRGNLRKGFVGAELEDYIQWGNQWGGERCSVMVGGRGGRVGRVVGNEELQGFLEVEDRAEEGLPKRGGELVIEPRQYPMGADEIPSLDKLGRLEELINKSLLLLLLL